MKIKRQFNNPVETFNYLMEYNIRTDEESDTEFYKNATEIRFNTSESNINVNRILRECHDKSNNFYMTLTQHGIMYKLTYIDYENMIELSHTYEDIKLAISEFSYIMKNGGINYVD